MISEYHKAQCSLTFSDRGFLSVPETWERMSAVGARRLERLVIGNQVDWFFNNCVSF